MKKISKFLIYFEKRMETPRLDQISEKLYHITGDNYSLRKGFELNNFLFLLNINDIYIILKLRTRSFRLYYKIVYFMAYCWF